MGQETTLSTNSECEKLCNTGCPEHPTGKTKCEISTAAGTPEQKFYPQTFRAIKGMKFILFDNHVLKNVKRIESPPLTAVRGVGLKEQ